MLLLATVPVAAFLFKTSKPVASPVPHASEAGDATFTVKKTAVSYRRTGDYMAQILNKLVAVALILMSTSINAQVNTSSTQGMLRQLMSGSAAPTVNAVSSGAVATASGDVLVRASGLRIPVPVSVAATASRARLASAALGCASVVGAVMCAATAAALAQALKDAGLGYGPCPAGSAQAYAFICKTPTSMTRYRDYFDINNYPSANAACQASMPQVSSQAGRTITRAELVGNMCKSYYRYDGVEYLLQSDSIRAFQLTLPPGGFPPEVPDETTMSQDLQTRLDQDYNTNRQLYDSMKADQRAAEEKGQLWPSNLNPIAPDTPITTTAPPVTSPERNVSTETRSLPDGSTDTIRRSETTTITPQTTGTTIRDSQTTFPSTTTVTTTTTNNVTNTSSTNTTVINNPPAEVQEFPDDYNKEITQKQILTEIKADDVAAPTANQNDRVTTETTKTNTDLDTKFTAIPNEFETDKVKWFSWVWSPPVGVCSPYAGTVHGYAISWDLCPTIANIREALGFIFALFGALQIYGLIFRSE